MASRDDSWLRDKHHGESWPRFAAEIPPELAEVLDEHVRRLRLKHGSFSRADAVRAGLRLYLNHQYPESDEAGVVDSDCIEIFELDTTSRTRGNPPEGNGRRTT